MCKNDNIYHLNIYVRFNRIFILNYKNDLIIVYSKIIVKYYDIKYFCRRTLVRWQHPPRNAINAGSIRLIASFPGSFRLSFMNLMDATHAGIFKAISVPNAGFAVIAVGYSISSTEEVRYISLQGVLDVWGIY